MSSINGATFLEPKSDPVRHSNTPIPVSISIYKYLWDELLHCTSQTKILLPNQFCIHTFGPLFIYHKHLNYVRKESWLAHVSGKDEKTFIISISKRNKFSWNTERDTSCSCVSEECPDKASQIFSQVFWRFFFFSRGSQVSIPGKLFQL